MRDAIERALATVAAETGVRVLHACESGSRAWGFASPNSDYDVRFLYVHDVAWYLRVFPDRDTIERMLPGDLDLSGWDLKKALGLFAKSNVALFEHLGSGIVYVDGAGLAARLRALVPEFFDPIAAGHHYLAIARTMRDSYLGGAELDDGHASDGRVDVKKLFYVLRPLAAFAWIEAHSSMPPTRFDDALAGIELGATERGWIAALHAQKVARNEGDRVPLDPRIRDWIDGWIARARDAAKALPSRRGRGEVLDDVFREFVRR